MENASQNIIWVIKRGVFSLLVLYSKYIANGETSNAKTVIPRKNKFNPFLMLACMVKSFVK